MSVSKSVSHQLFNQRPPNLLRALRVLGSGGPNGHVDPSLAKKMKKSKTKSSLVPPPTKNQVSNFLSGLGICGVQSMDPDETQYKTIFRCASISRLYPCERVSE